MPEVIYQGDLPAFTGRNVPIKEIASAIGKDAQYVRLGIQQGLDELLSGNEGRGKKKLDIAENFIKEYFGTNKVIPSNEIMMEAAKRSIKRNTLLSAKKKLGITSDKEKAEDGTIYWTWIMPE